MVHKLKVLLVTFHMIVCVLVKHQVFLLSSFLSLSFSFFRLVHFLCSFKMITARVAVYWFLPDYYSSNKVILGGKKIDSNEKLHLIYASSSQSGNVKR